MRESLQKHYIYTYDGACKVLGLEATILAEKGFTRFPSTRPAAEPRPGTPPLAPDGTPGNPQRPQQQWAGVWGRYSGAGAPGRKLERVEFPAFVAKQALLGFVPPAMQPLGGILLLF